MGYHKDWSLSYVKTPVEVLERIVHAVSMGGNMVVNFGLSGWDFRSEEKELAKSIGALDEEEWPMHLWLRLCRLGETALGILHPARGSDVLHG